MESWLKWLPPILETIVAALVAGHMAHLISSEVIVLVVAIAGAVLGYIAAVKQPGEPHEEQKGPPRPQPQPQK